MGFLKRVFGLSETNNVEGHNKSYEGKAEINQATDPKYQVAIVNIPIMWKQYGESIRLIKNTNHCDTYFERKDFIITRLGLIQRTLNYVGGSNSFIDPMTNTDITLHSADIDGIISDLKSAKYDEAFIKRYAESLEFKVNSLKTPKAKLNNIFKWQQWIEPYQNKIDPSLYQQFELFCSKLQTQVKSEIEK